MTIIYDYDKEKNPNGALSLPGVPLRPLTEKDLAGLQSWIIKSIEKAPYYKKVKPQPQPKADSVPEAPPKSEPAATKEKAETPSKAPSDTKEKGK